MHQNDKSGKIAALRVLNFTKLLHLSGIDPMRYSFEEYRKNGWQHAKVCGYCTACEERRVERGVTDENFSLTNISHGTHSADFLLALTERPNTTSWHDEPVLFVYESPSRDYKIYQEVEFGGYHKRPSRRWYWVHEDQECVEFPNAFTGGEYGRFILSAILTFHLRNSYATNLVKCGMNNPEGQFRGITEFSPDCVRTCFQEFLSREIEILEPRIIFAMGSAVENWLRELIGNRYRHPIQQLPHPAGRRRGFRDEYYEVLYFWLILRSLYKTGIIEMDEAHELAQHFLLDFETTPSSS